MDQGAKKHGDLMLVVNARMNELIEQEVGSGEYYAAGAVWHGDARRVPGEPHEPISVEAAKLQADMTEKLIRDALMLWATVDPIGNLSIFLGVTAGLTVAQRRKIALKATVYAFAILLGAIVIGQILLSGIGIQLVSLQVGGGIILFLFALQMIFGSVGQATSSEQDADHDVAVFPLAIPSIAGPGAIMAVIILTDNHLYSIPVQAATVGIMLAVLVVTYLFMIAADPIIRVIGRPGAAILVRVMGMILVALSVELILQALGLERWASPPA